MEPDLLRAVNPSSTAKKMSKPQGVFGSAPDSDRNLADAGQDREKKGAARIAISIREESEEISSSSFLSLSLSLFFLSPSYSDSA
jgi:hypothetical protein